METAQVLKIPEELAQRPRAQPTQRHKRLYRLVCEPGWRRAGVEAVLSTPGRNTPGGDGSTKRHIDRRTAGRNRLVQALQEELRHETSRPQPVNRVYIPTANGKMRPLGMACRRARAGQATVKRVVEPIYDSVLPPFSWGFRPLRSTHHALSAVRRGPADPKRGFQWSIAGDIASCFDDLDHRLLRQVLKKRVQDRHRLDLIPRLFRGGIWEDGPVRSPQMGTVHGSVVSPLLATIFLHAFDDWYVRTYRVRPEWAHLAPASLQYRRRKEIGGTLLLTRYADDGVAIWHGSRPRAEEITAEIPACLAASLKLRLSEAKPRITHIDDGFDFVGYRLTGDKRWSAGQWCVFARVPPKATQRFREAVKAIPRKTCTDEVAAVTAGAGLLRGWGNYYASAAQSRLMDSRDAFSYREVWAYCLATCRGRAKRAYQKSTRPRSARQVGTFQLGGIVGAQVVRLPRLSHIPRQRLTLSYPPPVYRRKGRDYTRPWAGTTDERWWDPHIWGGQEGRRNGQRRLAVAVLAREGTCRLCHEPPAIEVHHDPPWRDRPRHDPTRAMGVCVACHRRALQDVVQSDGAPRGSKGACGVRASGGG